MKEVKDRVPTKPNRIKLTMELDGKVVYAVWERADEPTEPGTKIDKELFDSIKNDIDEKLNTDSFISESDIDDIII